MPHRINAWHICISGYTQHAGRMSGLMRLWLAICSEYCSKTSRVELREWNSDWSRLAESIWLVWQEQDISAKPPRICIYAYSWGAGWGFTQLARELGKRGLTVDVAILCDPVYRHRYWLGQWRAFWPFSKIVVPRNVRRVTWFYQRQNLPCGHEVIAESKDTKINKGLPIYVQHQYMDDAPVFHARALIAARGDEE